MSEMHPAQKAHIYGMINMIETACSHLKQSLALMDNSAETKKHEAVKFEDDDKYMTRAEEDRMAKMLGLYAQESEDAIDNSLDSLEEET